MATTIRGTLGVCGNMYGSATYSKHQKTEFLLDAMDVGLQAVDKGKTAVAYNEKAQISGEWDSRDGGMLSWAV